MRLNRAAATCAILVTGHGFGHAVRSAEIARVLIARGMRVVVRTDAPRWLFPPGAEWLPSPGWPLDVGVAQRDSLQLDVDETRRRWQAFAADFDQRVPVEADLLRAAGADLALGDVPPLGFAAAHQAGIPSVAVTNFAWDWIYGAWPDFEGPIARIQEAYSHADSLLRLPLHAVGPDAFPAFRRVHDVPFVARTAAIPRDAMRARLGLPASACVVLLSFGGFDTADLDLGALAAWPEYLFVLTPPADAAYPTLPVNVRLLSREQIDYASVVGAADAVVTKPGYGIVVDCLVNRVPVLYTDRGPFREYPLLARGLETLGRARYAPSDDVRRGWLGPHLDALRASQTPWADVSFDGADVVADHVARHVAHGLHATNTPARLQTAVEDLSER